MLSTVASVPHLLDRLAIERIVEAIGMKLEGEWLLVGGALVALWLEPRRVTEDVDVMGLGGTAEERYALMELAIELGLPVEAVNSAADFFVHRVEGWRNEIEVLRSGSRSTIYRPTVTLFVLLKMARLSEQDLEDCRAALAHARAVDAPLNLARLSSRLAELQTTEDEGLRTRRLALAQMLAGSATTG